MESGIGNINIVNRKRVLDCFIQSIISELFVKILRNSTETYARTEILKFLFEISYKSPECVVELSKLGLPIIMTEELIAQAKGIEGLSHFTSSLLRLLANLFNYSMNVDVGKESLMHSLAVCVHFGESSIRTPAMVCACIVLLKADYVAGKELFFKCVIKLWKRLRKDINEPATPLCLASMHYYASTQEICTSLSSLEEFNSKLVKHLKSNETNLDMDFYTEYCQMPIIKLVKNISTSPEQRLDFIRKGIMEAIETIVSADSKEVRELANDLLMLYCTRCEVLVGPSSIQNLLDMIESKDENAVLVGIKCLSKLTKSSENNLLLIRSGCIEKLVNLLRSSKPNLAILSSDVVCRLMDCKEGQEQFIQSDGIPLIFPFIVHLAISQ